MKRLLAVALGLALLGGVFLPTASAQAPVAAAPVAIAPVAIAPVADAPVAAAPTSNLWTFLCPSAVQKAACKECFCKSPLGQMLCNITKPISLATGGLIQGHCADALNAADLKKPADCAEGAAARIKADEADAKARRAAVRYLGTVDCRRWPEAEDTLINALRADRNECVRMEAAFVLGRGCCCTKRTIAALSLTVAGGDKDGNPIEYSERVKGTAVISLEHCLACYVDVSPAPAVAPEKVPAVPVDPTTVPKDLPAPKALPGSGTPLSTGEYYKAIDKLSKATVILNARQALRFGTNTAQRGGRNGVLEIIQNAFSPSRPEMPTENVVLPAGGVMTSPAQPAIQRIEYSPLPVPSPAPKSFQTSEATPMPPQRMPVGPVTPAALATVSTPVQRQEIKPLTKSEPVSNTIVDTQPKLLLNGVSVIVSDGSGPGLGESSVTERSLPLPAIQQPPMVSVPTVSIVEPMPAVALQRPPVVVSPYTPMERSIAARTAVTAPISPYGAPNPYTPAASVPIVLTSPYVPTAGARIVLTSPYVPTAGTPIVPTSPYVQTAGALIASTSPYAGAVQTNTAYAAAPISPYGVQHPPQQEAAPAAAAPAEAVTEQKSAAVIQADFTAPVSPLHKIAVSLAAAQTAEVTSAAGKADETLASKLDDLLYYLRDGASAEDRQHAATLLTFSDFSTSTEVHQALRSAAQTDPSTAVRATCLGCLARMGAE